MIPGNVKTSLTFSDTSPKSAPSVPIQSLKVSPISLLRPGEVLEIQKQLTPQVTRQKKLAAENVSMVSHLPEEGECVQLCFSIHSIVLAFIFKIVVLQVWCSMMAGWQPFATHYKTLYLRIDDYVNMIVIWPNAFIFQI